MNGVKQEMTDACGCAFPEKTDDTCLLEPKNKSPKVQDSDPLSAIFLLFSCMLPSTQSYSHCQDWFHLRSISCQFKSWLLFLIHFKPHNALAHASPPTGAVFVKIRAQLLFQALRKQDNAPGDQFGPRCPSLTGPRCSHSQESSCFCCTPRNSKRKCF